MKGLSPEQLFVALEQTWPAAGRSKVGPWIIRQGLGGGKRVSAASALFPVDTKDIAIAVDAMRKLDQPALFVIHQQDSALDQMLEQLDYVTIDPVTLFAIMAKQEPPLSIVKSSWPPDEAMLSLWADGGIGLERINIMHRVAGPKTALSVKDKGVAFVALHENITMLHALEVSAQSRRQGVAQDIMKAATTWAAINGSNWLSLAVTEANLPANALYRSLGMQVVGRYHYRTFETGSQH
jgi:N-acetylglutamate synthase